MKFAQRVPEGAYIPIPCEELCKFLCMVRDENWGKAHLRIYAAMKEVSNLSAIPQTAHLKIPLRHFINGKGRIPREIQKQTWLEIAERLSEGDFQTTAKCLVDRKTLLEMAAGRFSRAEAVLLLLYFLRRKRPRKRLKAVPLERYYARFTYQLAYELTGIPERTCSRAITALITKGFFEEAEVAQQNINRYGKCLMDGKALTGKTDAENGRPMEGASIAESGVPIKGAARICTAKNGNPHAENGNPPAKNGRPNKLITRNYKQEINADALILTEEQIEIRNKIARQLKLETRWELVDGKAIEIKSSEGVGGIKS